MDTELLSNTFVDLADTLVADFDVIDFLQMLTERSVRLLSASATAVVLAGPDGELRVAAASSETAGLVELFQIKHGQGPCLDCFRTGRPVMAADLQGPGQRWPQFADAAVSVGFRNVQALPMRLRDEVIGTLNLFTVAPGGLDETGLRVGRALADVATIGLLQERSFRHQEALAEQLQGALNSRIIIEQARANSPSGSASTWTWRSGCCVIMPATPTSGSLTSPTISSAVPPPTSPPAARQPYRG